MSIGPTFANQFHVRVSLITFKGRKIVLALLLISHVSQRYLFSSRSHYTIYIMSLTKLLH